jgi:hypothetical protein
VKKILVVFHLSTYDPELGFTDVCFYVNLWLIQSIFIRDVVKNKKKLCFILSQLHLRTCFYKHILLLLWLLKCSFILWKSKVKADYSMSHGLEYNVKIFDIQTFNKIGEVYSLNNTDIPRCYSRHVGRCRTNANWVHCCVVGHSCTNDTRSLLLLGSFLHQCHEFIVSQQCVPTMGPPVRLLQKNAAETLTRS